MKVTHIMGEPLRFWVSSESGSTPHLVDIGEDACGCADWTCKHRKWQRETGKPYRCKHLKAAREAFLDDVIEAMKVHHLSQ